ncbi:MAG: hypothetical protein M3447_00110, partial [Acidobacteriota bacterium]|nr:hypothetical protein [Acidobacteriota bacterium]
MTFRDMAMALHSVAQKVDLLFCSWAGVNLADVLLIHLVGVGRVWISDSAKLAGSRSISPKRVFSIHLLQKPQQIMTSVSGESADFAET